MRIKLLAGCLLLALGMVSAWAADVGNNWNSDWDYWYDTSQGVSVMMVDGTTQPDNENLDTSAFMVTIDGKHCDQLSFDVLGPDESRLTFLGAFDHPRSARLAFDNHKHLLMQAVLHHNKGTKGWDLELEVGKLTPQQAKMLQSALVDEHVSELSVSTKDDRGQHFTGYYSLDGFNRSYRQAVSLCKNNGQ